MAKGVQNARRALHPAKLLPNDKIGKKVKGKFEDFDRKLEKKGIFAESTHLQGKEAEQKQKNMVATQRNQEELRLAEADSEIGRKKLLRTTGGRRSLIASR